MKKCKKCHSDKIIEVHNLKTNEVYFKCKSCHSKFDKSGNIYKKKHNSKRYMEAKVLKSFKINK